MESGDERVGRWGEEVGEEGPEGDQTGRFLFDFEFCGGGEGRDVVEEGEAVEDFGVGGRGEVVERGGHVNGAGLGVNTGIKMGWGRSENSESVEIETRE